MLQRLPQLGVGDGLRQTQEGNHCAAGRLSIDDLARRLGDVYGAQNESRPGSSDQGLAGRVSGCTRCNAEEAPVLAGSRSFPRGTPVEGFVRGELRAALREIVPRMGMQGFHLVEDVAPRRLCFHSDTGLDVTVPFHPALDGGSDVSAFGEAPRGIRKAFADLRD